MNNELILRLKEIYRLLEDEQSRDIYLNRLNFLITGDYSYIRYIVEKYVPELEPLNGKAVSNLLNSLSSDCPIILYGAGEDARSNLHYFKGDSRIKGFCDRDERKQKEGCEGYPVISPAELLDDDSKANIIISTHRGQKEIKEFLSANGIENNRIYEMSPYMFCLDTEQYFNPDFMLFDEREVFVDAGSKDLYTAKKLSTYVDKIEKIYAFEPDPNNYIQCLKNIQWFEEGKVEVIPCGTWSEKKTLSFKATADGSSHIADDGEISIDVITIDEVISNSDKVTFIKMDVEGAELESLKGAKNTILRDKPKLAICIYHKAEDMVTIPLYIKSLVPEYKLYIRHHSNGAGETVLYAMP